MSILDGMPSTEADLKAKLDFAAPLLDKFVSDLELPERATSILDAMKEGLSLGDIMGITKEHRDGLLAHAGRFLQLGEIEKARDVLVKLYQFEPLDERTIYALATTFQLEGDYAAAGKLYVLFLGLDATNPEGYLRLAECFLGAKEYDNAESTFKTALNFAKSAGDAACTEHAQKMIDVTRSARNGHAS